MGIDGSKFSTLIMGTSIVGVEADGQCQQHTILICESVNLYGYLM